jgi:hypothetical protein
MMSFISELESYSKGLSVIAYLVGIAGFIPATITFVRRTQQEIIENREKIYNVIDEKYFRINQTILIHPHLGVSWFQEGPTRKLSVEEKIQQLIIFDMITALFETTFLTYQRANSGQRSAQWEGWDRFIYDYCLKGDYRRWWQDTTARSEGVDLLYAQYDANFERYMNKKFKETNENQPNNLSSHSHNCLEELVEP